MLETLANGQWVFPTGDGGWRLFSRGSADPWYCKHCDFNREHDFDTVALHEQNCAARPLKLPAPKDPQVIARLSHEQLHQSLQRFDSLSEQGLHDPAQELLSTVVEALGGERCCRARSFAAFPDGNFIFPDGAWEPADHRRYIAVGGLDEALALIQKDMLGMEDAAGQWVASIASMDTAARDRMTQTTNHQCSADGRWMEVPPAQLVDYPRGIWLDLPEDFISPGATVLIKGCSGAWSGEEFTVRSFDASTELYQVARAQHSTAAAFKRERLQVLEEQEQEQEEQEQELEEQEECASYARLRASKESPTATKCRCKELACLRKVFSERFASACPNKKCQLCPHRQEWRRQPPFSVGQRVVITRGAYVGDKAVVLRKVGNVTGRGAWTVYNFDQRKGGGAWSGEWNYSDEDAEKFYGLRLVTPIALPAHREHTHAQVVPTPNLNKEKLPNNTGNVGEKRQLNEDDAPISIVKRSKPLT